MDSHQFVDEERLAFLLGTIENHRMPIRIFLQNMGCFAQTVAIYGEAVKPDEFIPVMSSYLSTGSVQPDDSTRETFVGHIRAIAQRLNEDCDYAMPLHQRLENEFKTRFPVPELGPARTMHTQPSATGLDQFPTKNPPIQRDGHVQQNMQALGGGLGNAFPESNAVRVHVPPSEENMPNSSAPMGEIDALQSIGSQDFSTLSSGGSSNQSPVGYHLSDESSDKKPSEDKKPSAAM